MARQDGDEAGQIAVVQVGPARCLQQDAMPPLLIALRSAPGRCRPPAARDLDRGGMTAWVGLLPVRR